MGNQDNTVILRVQLSEEDTEKKLSEIAVAVVENRKAQQELKKAYDANKVSAAEYGQQSVKLNSELRMQQTEQRNLTKNLDLYRAAVNGVAGSYDQAQAQLTLAQRTFRGMEGSLEDTTEASQALSAVVRDLRGQLKETDANSLDQFFRSIGDYPKPESLTPLIQQLVKLEETVKSGALTAEQAAAADAAVIGYKQRIAQAGAAEGKSYEETTNLVKGYGEAIRPATAALVQLEQEQKQVMESGQATGEQVAQIGFRFGQAQKSIKDATEALKEVPAEAEPLKGVGSTIAELDSTTGAFGGQVANLKQRFATAKQGIDLAKGGFTGLKGAIASTGIGILILALGALYEYFTKTDEGAEDLAAALAFLKGAFSVVESVVISVGKGLVKVFTDPKEAAKDLLGFIEDQVVNRVKALGVIFNALRNGDFKEATNGVLQYATGVENVIGKTKAFAEEAKRAATAAYEISRANDALEDSERDSLKTLAENKNLIDKLVLSAKDRTLTEQQRLANLDKAGALERTNLQTTIAQANERLRIARLENDEAERVGKTSDELRDKVAQAQAAVINLAGESANLQQSIQNRRSALLQQEASDEKAAAQKAQQAAEKAAEARLQARREAISLELLLLERQLKQTQANSNEELSILQSKLNLGRDLELAQAKLTVGQRKIIEEKYQQDSLALTLDFNRRKLQAALQAAVDTTAAELAGQQAGGAEALRLQAQQIEQQRLQAMAGLAANADNSAKIAAINAQAAQQQRQLEFQQATRDLQAYLDEKRRIIEADYASGTIQEAEYQRRLAATAKAGTDAQAVINSDYRQDNTENQKKANADETEAIRRHTAEVKQTEEAKQQIKEATVQAFQEGTDAVIAAFGEESAAGQAALVFKKTLALAEIAIGLEKQFAANAETGAKISAIAPPFTTPLGIAYTIATDAAAVAAAASSVANILKFEQGGIAYGPSHAQGGIPLYRNGRHAGIEIEGGEPVLTRRVTDNPLLLSLASTVNQLAGGRALVPNLSLPRLALGGVAQPLILDQLRGGLGDGINYDKLAEANARALRKSPPVTRISDVKASLARDAETQRQSNT